jgi:molybdate transport system permease protein
MTPQPSDITVIVRTLGLSGIAVMLAFVPAVSLAYLSARDRLPGSTIVETVLSLPLALPPVAVGLFLLKLFSTQTPLGRTMAAVGLDVPFTWRAVVVATGVMSFPLIYRPIKSTFEQIDTRYESLSRTLGQSPIETFFSVSLPLGRNGIGSGIFLGWSRAIGEFGCTIVLAGDIPGVTRTLSLAIFHRYQVGQDLQAVRLAVYSGLLTLLFMGVSNWLGRDPVD